jgi:cellulose synthase/poly-beta-1,6-N-acetylglucosamine synthase-like glycosyltransferase
MYSLLPILFWISLPFQLVVAFYLLQPWITLVGYATGKRRLLPPAQPDGRPRHYAAIVTAHQITRFVPPLVDSLRKQTHPHVYICVVADDCQPEPALDFGAANVQVLYPQPPLHSKVQSIAYALAHLPAQPDAVTVFDADNLVHPGYFAEVDRFFQGSFLAVMGHVKAKKPHSDYAQLDSAGEILNSFLFRKASMALGVTANVDGKGLTVDYQVYKSIEYQHLLGGFDKKVQADLALKVPQVAYADHAYVYDEKIPDAGALRKQRTRWMNTYFKYFATNWQVFAQGMKQLSLGRMYVGLNLLRPPIFLLLGSVLGFALLFGWLHWGLATAWGALLLGFFVGMAAILTAQGASLAVWKALWKVPHFIWQQILALLKMKQANTSFLKTEHHQVYYIEDVI